jgi:hypothetical protein
MDRDERNRRRRERNRKLRGAKPRLKRDVVGGEALEHREKFYSLVVKEECWFWIGGYSKPDFGERVPLFNFRGRATVKAKAFAWADLVKMTKKGHVPPLRAKCLNPCCVNPSHHRIGEPFPFPISPSKAQRMLIDYERTSESLGEMAHRTGIPERTVKRILDEMAFAERCMDRVYALRAERKMDGKEDQESEEEAQEEVA